VATEEWLKSAFAEGYDSGDILSPVPSSRRLHQEALIGGSYREAFHRAVFPFLRPDSRVLELGPGKGSWWNNATEYRGRLVRHRVDSFTLDGVPDRYFDVCFSFGVLCHHAIEQIGQVLHATRSKMALGGVAMHQYAETHKFYRSGRAVDFPDLPSLPDSWWPPNTVEAMAVTAEAAGWTVIEADMGLFDRDGMILLKAWY
jgi:hypothetical protein